MRRKPECGEKGVADLVKLNIDGHGVEVAPGTTIIEAARSVGVEIPNLCYDKHLTAFSGCRMCVVELEGSKKLVTSCSTLVKEGMVVKTKTDRIVRYRKSLLDLILGNHPQDCLTCEKVGNCKLQDLCYEYGVQKSRWPRTNTVFPLDEANPVVIRDQNKCIKCGKCVRVCREVQVTGTVDFVGRGVNSTVTTSFDRPIDREICRMCGQCVAACPTGALINKHFVGTRPWEVTKVRTTCPFCGTGCNFDLNVKNGRVVGVTPAEDAPINGTQLCVKGRFHTDLIHSPDRLTHPLIKVDGKFERTTWDRAIRFAADRFSQIVERYGPDSVAGLSSARCTNEDNFVFQKFMRAAIGTNNVDHCART